MTKEPASRPHPPPLPSSQAELPCNSKALEQQPLTQICLRLYIPRDYYQEPVLSRLISEYGLVVNVTAAILIPDTDGQGRFDLELKGTAQQISNGLNYLKSLDIRLVLWINPTLVETVGAVLEVGSPQGTEIYFP